MLLVPNLQLFKCMIKLSKSIYGLIYVLQRDLQSFSYFIKYKFDTQQNYLTDELCYHSNS